MNLSPFILSLLGNTVIAIGIISLLFVTDALRRKTMKKMDNLVAFTVGLIIAIVLLGFLPEIIDESSISGQLLGFLLLSGMFLFYILELFLHWHHCKDLGENNHHHHEHENNTLMFTGTFLHNVLHGVILFSAFSIDIRFGIATTLAVLLHAIPQNIANLLMNHKDIRFAYIAAFGGVFGALITYPFTDIILNYNFHLLAIIGGGLLYTAMSDILPSFKEKGDTKHKIVYLFCMVLGVFLFSVSAELLHTKHTHEEIHNEKHHEYIDENEH